MDLNTENKIKELEEKVRNLEYANNEIAKSLNDIKEKLKEEKESLEKENTNKKWKPKKGQQYFYLGGMGEIHACLWTDSYGDDLRYLLNNVFRTENDAIECQKKIKFQARFKNFVEERNEKLDWKNNKQTKYHLQYDNYNNVTTYDWNQSYKIQGVIYASSEQILRDAIAEIGEENIKKYVLEVKE